MIKQIEPKKSTINIPSKQYDVSKMTFIQKLEILFDDPRFNNIERNGLKWKIGVCIWNGLSMKPVYIITTKEDAVDWALNTLNLVK